MQEETGKRHIQEETGKRVRVAYSLPELRVYGDVAKLTQSKATGTGNDHPGSGKASA